MNGSGGDPLAFALTGLGVFLSILAIVSSEKKGLPIFSLVLSLSFPINILLWIIFLFTGVMDFGT
ncbi:hypothetical protein JCM19046_5057 [Bacillus sp. JCM 19046]|nr:hypothetical protein JCM19046_5057 [Bacillus sp. JCM 19046]